MSNWPVAIRWSGKLTGLPLEASTLERTRGALGVVDLSSREGTRLERVHRLSTVALRVTIRGLRRSEEGIARLGGGHLGLVGEVGALEDGGNIAAHALGADRRLGFIVERPLGRKGFLPGGEVVEALLVAAQPEVELQVLGRQLNVLEVVHEVARSAGLEHVGQYGVGDEGRGGILTGQVPPEMMRSKERASGIPLETALLPELTDSLTDFCFASPEMESREEMWETCEGRR